MRPIPVPAGRLAQPRGGAPPIGQPVGAPRASSASANYETNPIQLPGPMTSLKQIEANRRNALKSMGSIFVPCQLEKLGFGERRSESSASGSSTPLALEGLAQAGMPEAA